jgi:hypothetical protein
MGPAPVSKRAAVSERAALLAEHTDEVAGAAEWLREVDVDALPDAGERVYRDWHGFGYHHPEAGYVCAVLPRSDEVLLAFERGPRGPRRPAGGRRPHRPVGPCAGAR